MFLLLHGKNDFTEIQKWNIKKYPGTSQVNGQLLEMRIILKTHQDCFSHNKIFISKVKNGLLKYWFCSILGVQCEMI